MHVPIRIRDFGLADGAWALPAPGASDLASRGARHETAAARLNKLRRLRADRSSIVVIPLSRVRSRLDRVTLLAYPHGSQKLFDRLTRPHDAHRPSGCVLQMQIERNSQHAVNRREQVLR